jgi:hypothetical protein
MASIEQLVSQPATPLVVGISAAGGALSLQPGAPGTRTRYYVTGIMFSASAAPAAPTTATLTIRGTTITIQVPASAYAAVTINFSKPIESNLNENIALAVGAHGGAVLVSGAILGWKASS